MRKKLFLATLFSLFFETCFSMINSSINQGEYGKKTNLISSLAPASFPGKQSGTNGQVNQSKQPVVFVEVFETPAVKNTSKRKPSVFEEVTNEHDFDTRNTYSKRSPLLHKQLPSNNYEGLHSVFHTQQLSQSAVTKPTASDSRFSLCPSKPAVFVTETNYPYGGLQTQISMNSMSSLSDARPEKFKHSLSPSSNLQLQPLSNGTESTSAVNTGKQLSSSSSQPPILNVYDSPESQRLMSSRSRTAARPTVASRIYRDPRSQTRGQSSIVDRTQLSSSKKGNDLKTDKEIKKEETEMVKEQPVLPRDAGTNDSKSASKPSLVPTTSQSLSTSIETNSEGVTHLKLKEDKRLETVESRSSSEGILATIPKTQQAVQGIFKREEPNTAKTGAASLKSNSVNELTQGRTINNNTSFSLQTAQDPRPLSANELKNRLERVKGINLMCVFEALADLLIEEIYKNNTDSMRRRYLDGVKGTLKERSVGLLDWIYYTTNGRIEFNKMIQGAILIGRASKNKELVVTNFGNKSFIATMWISSFMVTEKYQEDIPYNNGYWRELTQWEYCIPITFTPDWIEEDMKKEKEKEKEKEEKSNSDCGGEEEDKEEKSNSDCGGEEEDKEEKSNSDCGGEEEDEKGENATTPTTTWSINKCESLFLSALGFNCYVSDEHMLLAQQFLIKRAQEIAAATKTVDNSTTHRNVLGHN